MVIRGETAHFDHICNAAASGLSAVGPRDRRARARSACSPARTSEQAEARSGGDKGNAGIDAADAAIVMTNMLADGR